MYMYLRMCIYIYTCIYINIHVCIPSTYFMITSTIHMYFYTCYLPIMANSSWQAPKSPRSGREIHCAYDYPVVNRGS